MRILKVLSLKKRASEVQPVELPRRARIVHVRYIPQLQIDLYYEIHEDETTAALATKHARSFVAIQGDAPIPDGAGFIGADGPVVIYEVKPS